MAVANLNGDGLPDIIVANYSSNTVSVLMNTMAPGATVASFAPQQAFATGSNPFSVVAADLNGDGRPDLLVADFHSDSVSVLLNTTAPGAATATFAPTQTVSTGIGTYPSSAAVADLNGDGRPDIIAADYGSGSVSVLLNTTAPGSTTPSFGAPQIFATGNGPSVVAVADLNGDGRPDIVAANEYDGTVSVLLNTTAPGATTFSFAAQQTYTNGSAANSEPNSIALADLNGNGLPDIITANYFTASVSVLMNTPAIIGSDTATGTIDSAPVVQSFVRADPNPSNAGLVDFTITFSEAISGLTASNLILSGTAAGTIGTPTTSDGGIIWSVPVTTGGDGTLGLTVNNRTGIVDSNGNQLYDSTSDDGAVFNPVIGPLYTIDQTAPMANITANPPTITNSTAATFSFTGVDPVSNGVSSGINHLQTEVDGGVFATATSPQTFTGLAAGSHTFEVEAVDNAGNVSTPASDTWTIDLTAPTITAITSSTPNGIYYLGATINVTVHFSKPVTQSGGDLTVNLNSGGAVTISPFGPASSVSGTYTVLAGQDSPELDSLSPLTLAGLATLRDAAGNNAVLTIPAGQSLANNADLDIDTVAPSVSIPLTGTPGNDQFVIQMKAGDDTTLQYSINGGATFTNVAAASVTGVNVTGMGGNDTLTLNLANGLLTGSSSLLPLTFTGEVGSDQLIVVGNPGGTVNETFTASPATSGNGTLVLANATASVTLALAGVTGIQDTSPVASLTINADDQSNAILIGAGPTVSGAATNTVRGLDLNALVSPDQTAATSANNNNDPFSGGNGEDENDLTGQAFMSLSFANKTGVTINGVAGDDLFILETTIPAAGLQTLALNGGTGFSVLSAIAPLTGVTTSLVNIGATRTGQVDTYIARLYELCLDRNASNAELSGWETVAANSGLAAVAQGIEGSLEAQADKVKVWYQQYLGRAASQAEANSWGQDMVNGVTEEQVLSGILGSTEFFNRAQTLISTGTADQRFVSTLYQLVLNRAGGSTEVSGWVQSLPTLGTTGISLGFVTSLEFRSDSTAGLYDNLLHRQASVQEINGWAASNLNLLQIREGFLESAEFEND